MDKYIYDESNDLWYELQGRMLPLLIMFFLVLLPQFLTNLSDTHNYYIAAFVGGVLIMYIVIFAIFFVKYSQYKRERKYYK